MRTTKYSGVLVLIAMICCSIMAEQPDYSALKGQAEKFYAEGSFVKAHEIYTKIQQLAPESERRWVTFRIADTLWRAQPARAADSTEVERAREQLEELVRDVKRVEDRDRTWAEAEESLGDLFWTRRHALYWDRWPHYQNALDWWAGSKDLELARHRYLGIVWKLSQSSFGADDVVAVDVLENAVKIAVTEDDQAHAHALLAMALSKTSDVAQQQRAAEEFEAAIRLGKKTEWYGRALFTYALWVLQPNRFGNHDGSRNLEPDYPKALQLLRRITTEFQEGENRFYQFAKTQIEAITKPMLSVAVANVFLPDSEIQYALSWKIHKRIDLSLYKIDLTRDVSLSSKEEEGNDWLGSIRTGSLEKTRSWSYDTKDKGHYKERSEQLRLSGKLAPGAYLLEATAGGERARELMLVTDATVVLQTAKGKALVYVCDALAGSPLAGAEIKLWERYPQDNRWYARETTKKADTNGIALFDITAPEWGNVFVAAKQGDKQAFGVSTIYPGAHGNSEQRWNIYAYTDRPAYRPNEIVHWKLIARRSNGSVYSTPANQVLAYDIYDARGSKIKEGEMKLNSFGSAWGSVEVTESMPLGEYRITFFEKDRKEPIGDATLFRLEEYKLPEFKVSVQTPEENGKRKAFRLGEKVTATIQAEYYFGGPVANANVEVLVYQNQLYRIFHKPRAYPWYYDESSRDHGYGRDGQIIKRDTLKTDAQGKTSVSFETPRGSMQDFEYRIEARVTDASRREISGDGRVRVTRQRYYVQAEPEHCIYRPQEKVTIDFKAIDANDQPVQAEGAVTVTRDFWFEIWVDPAGREIKGEELKQIRERSFIFPPPPSRPEDRPWQLKFRGYEKDEILTRTLKTDTNGVAHLIFTPERDGYYRISWKSDDTGQASAAFTFTNAPIEAETAVWVATTRTSELGYRHGGMEIIVDQDTFRVGQTAPVMLSVPANDRYVLFSVTGDNLESYQLVHMEGTVKLIQLPIEEKHVPNIFLEAALVSDREMFVDGKEVIVPPTRNFLSVDVKADRQEYQPQTEGVFTITTRDHDNKPVSAEVSFGLVDESVYFIQSDYAADPRQFFFGNKRQRSGQITSTFNQKSFAKLVEGELKQLIDVKQRAEFWGQAVESGAMRESSFDSAQTMTLDRYSRLRKERAVVRNFSASAADFDDKGALYEMKVPQSGLASRKKALPELAAPVAMGIAGTGLAEQEPAVQVRSDFRSTVLWIPDVVTGKDGIATVKVKYPDSLTGWKSTARAASEANQFGIGTNTTRTKQPLIVRLQAPRFFLVGDVLTISAVINNNTDQKLRVSSVLDTEGVTISGLYVSTNGVVKGERAPYVEVEPNGETRVDWAITVRQAGMAKLKVTARGGNYADAMEKSYPIYEHGIEKFVSKSGKMRSDEVKVTLNLPKARKPESTRLVVQVTPSIAVTMLDALPYLIDYPYGCTEQTMSRFLPAAITAKTLKDLGIKPEDVMGRAFGGIELAHVAKTQSKGKRDLRKLDEITQQSLKRLYDFQHGDGGWGWWKEGESDHWMSAYVVWGLALARDAGLEVRAVALEQGANYLDKVIVESEVQYDQQAWILHALSVYHASTGERQPTKFQQKAFENLWNNREKLNAYSRALLALAAHNYKFHDQAKILVQNLENGVKRDEKPDTSVIMQSAQTSHNAVMGTAHWGEEGIFWRWSEGGIEATAFALRALLAIDPQNKLIEPVTNWLIKNRRGAQWSNTRDTAMVVFALNDYLRTTKELSADLDFELLVNGASVARKQISGVAVFDAPSQFDVERKLLRDGDNHIQIVRRSGTGTIYFGVNAQYFSLEEPITPAGNEIFVRREYYKMAGRPTLLKGYVYDRQPLADGDVVKSGDRVQCVITVDAKNDYEYLVFEDLKPAGFEAVEIRSGERLDARELKSETVQRRFGSVAGSARQTQTRKQANKAAAYRAQAQHRRIRLPGGILPPDDVSAEDYTGRSQWVYQELRDRKMALFLNRLPQGVWEMTCDYRAEAPGQFHALPVVGHAMYVPEIRCNGLELRIKVEDK